jgi:hypothetical protein
VCVVGAVGSLPAMACLQLQHGLTGADVATCRWLGVVLKRENTIHSKDVLHMVASLVYGTTQVELHGSFRTEYPQVGPRNCSHAVLA